MQAAMCKLLFYGLIVTGISACRPSDGGTAVVMMPQPASQMESVDSGPVGNFMNDSAALARGEALFAGSCAGYCHSHDGPNADAVYLFDCEWKNGGSDEDIFRTVTIGIPNTRMVGFGTNFPEGDDDLWRIIAYIRTKQESCD
ncbi:MAG: hypothetical protein RLZZ385_60 [Pseudomonadota bacterium]|jgi:mono/diheme cytochrome c family protein